MPFALDNYTLLVMQAAAPSVLFLVMLHAWRSGKTYPGFGHWTISKVPYVIGAVLLGLRGWIPDWLSAFTGSVLIMSSPVILYEGLRLFQGKMQRDGWNRFLLLAGAILFAYFYWLNPDYSRRLIILTGVALIVNLRALILLVSAGAPELEKSRRFTAAMFGVYVLALWLRLVTAFDVPALGSPVQPDGWQSLLYTATIFLPVGWNFGLLLMTNDRLTAELRAAQVELRAMAGTDFLTSTANRRSFTEICQREAARARRLHKPLSLVIFDIDHFKHFNDTYGHLEGDAALLAVARACRAQLRQVDVLARWGGEEFALLLPDTDHFGCRVAAEKLRLAVANLTLTTERGPARLTISLGGAVWDTQSQDLQSALRSADDALYLAKDIGRNCTVMAQAAIRSPEKVLVQ